MSTLPGSSAPFRARVILGLLAAAAIVTAGVLVSPSRALATLESLAADPFLFGLVVAAVYLVRPLLAWPTTPLSVVVGYGYGVALGVPIALAGILVTVLPVFLAVRLLSGSDNGTTEAAANTDADREAVGAGTLERALRRTDAAVDRYYETAGPTRGVIASRLAPIPSDAATCAAATSDVRLHQFLVGTAIGELPWTVAAVVVGASAATITTAGLGDLGLRLSIGCGFAALFLLAGPLYRVVRTRVGLTDSGTGRANG
ncbi:TVP38/TMEM64 family protein [Halopiger xanaduensis]|uniref:SNARE associated Golgi protein-related protein n=1 Tax=Halopiger xanaduensis (strain DSM 18323 / JCM 14033 / SH-6) TaxID=797210 RepID=F8D9V0_HALXS|nr:VTT domain-containing protein [Halopiger xanaduensis]AEH35727.1 SNARE associated Golgi protein-related protein [Halopiger xanaduensis SH-6]